MSLASGRGGFRDARRIATMAIVGVLACLTGGLVLRSTVDAQGVPLEQADIRPGAAVYLANCAACHQPRGSGLRGSVPPLAGNVSSLLATVDGRNYLINALLYGVSGPVTVAGERFDGLMPSWRHLSDAQLASVLNYAASAWVDEGALAAGLEAITPLEVSLSRTHVLQSSEVGRLRPR